MAYQSWNGKKIMSSWLFISGWVVFGGIYFFASYYLAKWAGAPQDILDELEILGPITIALGPINILNVLITIVFIVVRFVSWAISPKKPKNKP